MDDPYLGEFAQDVAMCVHWVTSVGMSQELRKQAISESFFRYRTGSLLGTRRYPD
jgi:hypothetical protein